MARDQGGLSYDSIGFQINLHSFEVGLTQARRKWVMKWMENALRKRAIVIRHFGDVLGRVQYITLVLEHLRPFLGPMYACVSAIPASACLKYRAAV